MDFDSKNMTYRDRATGEVVPVECIDRYAKGKLEAALAKLANAWVAARAKVGTNLAEAAPSNDAKS